jgi:hypothetical protein
MAIGPAIAALNIAIKAGFSKAVAKAIPAAVVKTSGNGYVAMSGKKALASFGSRGAANDFANGYTMALKGGRGVAPSGGLEAKGFSAAKRDISKISDRASRVVSSELSAVHHGSSPGRFHIHRGRGTRPSSGDLPKPNFRSGVKYSAAPKIVAPKFSNFSSGQKYSSAKYSMASQSPKFSSGNVSHGKHSVRFGNTQRRYQFGGRK